MGKPESAEEIIRIREGVRGGLSVAAGLASIHPHLNGLQIAAVFEILAENDTAMEMLAKDMVHDSIVGGPTAEEWEQRMVEIQRMCLQLVARKAASA